MADCRRGPLSAACGDFVSTLSQHAAFKNDRCPETPFCERCASRRSVAACRCLHRRGAGFSPRGRRRLVVGTLPSLGATLPLRPCLAVNLARARLRSRLAAIAFFRLYRVETSRPRDGRRSIRCNRPARAMDPRMRARACISPSSALPSLRIPVHRRSASSPRRTQCTARSQLPMRGVNPGL
jgi:hypothetical protein